jgi:nitrate reductase alpha subunit
VPESADWYNSGYIIAWGSNVPQTRTPDAHFFTEVRYKGTKTVAITPDYAEVDQAVPTIWLNPKQGTDAALANGHGPRHPARVSTSTGRCRILHRLCAPLHRHADAWSCWKKRMTAASCRAGCLRASDLVDGMGEENNPEWKTIAIDEASGELVCAKWLNRLPLGREGQMEPEEQDRQGLAM